MNGGHEWIEKVYASESVEETEAAYDGWAESYDADLRQAGYIGPALIAAMVSRHIQPGNEPILEAAVGTGLVGQLLCPLGYGNLVGIDLSADMLKVAEHKGYYSGLRQMRLGETLDFPDNHFVGILVTGAFTPGHAEPDSFPELTRITRSGAPMIFTLRVDGGAGDAFIAEQDRFESAGVWKLTEVTDPLNIMPITEPDVFHRIFVYHVT